MVERENLGSSRSFSLAHKRQLMILLHRYCVHTGIRVGSLAPYTFVAGRNSRGVVFCANVYGFWAGVWRILALCGSG